MAPSAGAVAEVQLNVSYRCWVENSLRLDGNKVAQKTGKRKRGSAICDWGCHSAHVQPSANSSCSPKRCSFHSLTRSPVGFWSPFTGRLGSPWWSQSPCCGWSPRLGWRSQKRFRPSTGRGNSRPCPPAPAAAASGPDWRAACSQPFLPHRRAADLRPGKRGCSRPSSWHQSRGMRPPEHSDEQKVILWPSNRSNSVPTETCWALKCWSDPAPLSPYRNLFPPTSLL